LGNLAGKEKRREDEARLKKRKEARTNSNTYAHLLPNANFIIKYNNYIILLFVAVISFHIPPRNYKQKSFFFFFFALFFIIIEIHCT